MKTTTKVKQWGNSLAIRIPKGIAQDLGLINDSDIQIISNGSSATIKPKQPAVVTLQELIDQITPDNVHQEVEWGNPVGQEQW